MSAFAVGSLVSARGREWVVLPSEEDQELLPVRPLGGREDETTALLPSLEEVTPASFALPTADQLGDHRSCSLLRDTLRLGFRNSAGPFRSFARIAVEPRPYQLVPLLMALKLDPVRLLIADDLGVGKSIEAALIARELLDRGEIRRFAVLCPPHLAEQWQEELRSKFNIDAQLVLSSTANALEKRCMAHQSIFEVYDHVVISMDFIKQRGRKDEFLRTSPDLLIVDEAHTCAYSGDTRSGQHLRWDLINELSRLPEKHIVLVTATPHTGKEENFRSLLCLLDPSFANLPEDLSGQRNEAHRRRLAQHFVQRRRGDILNYMEAATHFPTRLEKEETYKLHPEYARLFDRVIDYARETVHVPGEAANRQRIRWWSAIALLRSLASSPASAAASLRSRAGFTGDESQEEIDEAGRRLILDATEVEGADTTDSTPGSDVMELMAGSAQDRRRLLALADEADALVGEKDEKLKKAAKLLKQLVSDGSRPIVFCRFIHTAEYVAEQLRSVLPKGVEVAAVTGSIPPSEREERILELSKSDKRLLVCTDCLSEGINLQDHFDAVFHYDLGWSPTRHEQREGRVDRYGQAKDQVHVVTYYGTDTKIDGIVLDVLIRKHQVIKSTLGISVPVPAETNKVVEAIFEGLLLRGARDFNKDQLELFAPDQFASERDAFHKEWVNASEREKRSRTMFAQEGIKVDEVARELEASREAIGSGTRLPEFVTAAIEAVRGTVRIKDDTYHLAVAESPIEVRDLLRDTFGKDLKAAAKFQLPVPEGTLYFHRTHRAIEAIANHIFTTALDTLTPNAPARRAGVIRTRSVGVRTTLLLVRFRYHILTKRGDEEYPLLAEDCQLVAYRGAATDAEWLTEEEATSLLQAIPDASREVPFGQAKAMINSVIEGYEALVPHLNQVAKDRGDQLLDQHRRVRDAARQKGVTYRVEPNLPADVLGVYVYLP
jgi:superfamily II DNA or RNA helicase